MTKDDIGMLWCAMDTTQLAIRVPNAVLRQARELAAAEDRPLAAMLNVLIKRGLAAQKTPAPNKEDQR
jgi:hypothetical protein